MYSVSVFHAPLTARQLSVCSAHTYLFQSLLFLFTIIFYTLIIIKVAFRNVNVKFGLPIAFPYISTFVQVFNLCTCKKQYYNNMISVPATIRHNPTAAFFVRRSLNTIKENAMDTKILSLSIGTTTLAIPSCSAL